MHVHTQIEIAAHFEPRRSEKIFPSVLQGLIQNSARSLIFIGMNGIEPTTGSEGSDGGSLRPLLLML